MTRSYYTLEVVVQIHFKAVTETVNLVLPLIIGSTTICYAYSLITKHRIMVRYFER